MRKRDCNEICLSGNSDIVKRKLNMTGFEIISSGDNITYEPLLIQIRIYFSK